MIQFYLAWHTKALKIGLKTRDHASGDPSPSREDILITKKLATAGDIVGIKVPDHIIVAENGYTSMLEKGYLKTG
jgi:DNA repair protein RadC